MSATKAVSTTANVESPLKKVEELAVPDPNLAVGTVPDAILEPFKLVNDAPEPLKVVAVRVPVTVAPDDVVSNFLLFA